MEEDVAMVAPSVIGYNDEPIAESDIVENQEDVLNLGRIVQQQNGDGQDGQVRRNGF